VGKPEIKRSLGRLKLRWVGNIKMDRKYVGWDGMDRIDISYDRD
jgi:hypothetical protein